MTGHGYDTTAATGCLCAACHQRRHELDVLAQLAHADEPSNVIGNARLWTLNRVARQAAA